MIAPLLWSRLTSELFRETIWERISTETDERDGSLLVRLRISEKGLRSRLSSAAQIVEAMRPRDFDESLVRALRRMPHLTRYRPGRTVVRFR